MKTRCPDCKTEFDIPDGMETFFCPECGGKLVLSRAELHDDGAPASEDDWSVFDILAELLSEGEITQEEYDARIEEIAAEAEGVGAGIALSGEADGMQLSGEPPEPSANGGGQPDKTLKRRKRRIIAIAGIAAMVCVVAVAAVLAISMTPQGSRLPWMEPPDATREKGELPNLPLVMSQMGEWDEETFKAKMGLQKSDSPADLEGAFYESETTSIGSNIENPGSNYDISVVMNFYGTSATTAKSYALFMNNVFESDLENKTMISNDEIDRATYLGSAYDSDALDEMTGGVLNENAPGAFINEFGRNEALALLTKCGISSDLISDQVESAETRDGFIKTIQEPDPALFNRRLIGPQIA